MMQRAYPARRRHARQRGQLFVVGVLLIGVLVGIAGISVDALRDIGDAQRAQAAADTAAMTAAFHVGGSPAISATDPVVVSAERTAALAGIGVLTGYSCVVSSGAGNTLDVVFYDVTPPAPPCSTDPAGMHNRVEVIVPSALSSPDCLPAWHCVEVKISHVTTNFFGSSLGFATTTSQTQAVAITGPPPRLVI